MSKATLYHWDNVENEQLNPLLSRKFVTGEKSMFPRIVLAKACVVPRHSHPNEQITFITQAPPPFTFSAAPSTTTTPPPPTQYHPPPPPPPPPPIPIRSIPQIPLLPVQISMHPGPIHPRDILSHLMRLLPIPASIPPKRKQRTRKPSPIRSS